jgi:Rrf2 family transcriptional regulator, nitric oxide-sensitive transcriptional repressor
MFSQTAEYALRAIVVLAGEAQESWTAEEVATASLVPQHYLMKVLQRLAREGLVTAHRGRGGGFVLRRPPGAITVLDVINAVDPLRRIEHCPLGLKSHGEKLCPLHRKMDDAVCTVEKAFACTTIGELLADPSPVRPLREGGTLCHVQVAQ